MITLGRGNRIAVMDGQAMLGTGIGGSNREKGIRQAEGENTARPN